MTKSSEERIRIWHPDGHEHKLIVAFASFPSTALIWAAYESGCSKIEAGLNVARWRVDYEPPTQFDSGYICLGDGRIDIEIQELRGMGLGSLLMLPLIRWAKNRPGDAPVVPINLKGQDAKTEGERDRRNMFYKKLGFEFNYGDPSQTFGESVVMPASKLITPAFKMSRGWQVESLSGTGGVF